MSEKDKIKKLLSKMKTDGEDIYTLAEMIEADYFNTDDSPKLDSLLDDSVKVYKDLSDTLKKLMKIIK